MSHADPAPSAAASDNPASRNLPEPIESALRELVSVSIEAVGDGEPRLLDALGAVRDAIRPSLLPAEMTPAIREVLGLMIFRTGPLGHLYRAAGEAIPPKVEDEQAFVLWRFLRLALQHGPDWYAASCRDVEAARTAAVANLPPEPKPTGDAP